MPVDIDRTDDIGSIQRRSTFYQNIPDIKHAHFVVHTDLEYCPFTQPVTHRQQPANSKSKRLTDTHIQKMTDSSRRVTVRGHDSLPSVYGVDADGTHASSSNLRSVKSSLKKARKTLKRLSSTFKEEDNNLSPPVMDSIIGYSSFPGSYIES